MRRVPELPRGWSFPIEASEVSTYFPGVERVVWSADMTTLKEWIEIGRRCLRISWEPTTAEPLLTLTIWAVPTEHRIEVRKWIDDEVGPESRAWMQSLDVRDSAWLRHGHAFHWFWHPAPSST